KELELLVIVDGVTAAPPGLAWRQRLDEVPVVVAAHQPAKAFSRMIQEVLLPEILDAFDCHAAEHATDVDVFIVAKLAGLAEWDDGRMFRPPQRLEETEIALLNVEQRIAAWAGDALRLVRRVQRQRRPALGAIELAAFDLAQLVAGLLGFDGQL